MNDPNGLIQWNGIYHLFYQYNPEGAYHHRIHWGHASSRDLIHWEHHPIALTPSEGGPDQNGCWSGCIVNDNGVPTLFYTTASPQTQYMATSEDHLITWQKSPHNPIIATAPDIPNLRATEFRDPWVWYDNGIWNMILGSGIVGAGGTILLYQSLDLHHWTFVDTILSGQIEDIVDVWECPNLFELNGKHVLLFSETPGGKHTYTMVGTYEDHHFMPEKIGTTDAGSYFYAALTLRDDLGRRLMWGWIREGRSTQAQREAGWSGVMSLPRVLSILPDGSFGMRPAPELAALRRDHTSMLDLDPLDATTENPLASISGDALEIQLRFEATGELELQLRRTPDESETTRIIYSATTQELVVDALKSSLSADVTPERVAVPVPANRIIDLHIFLDNSVLEVFVGDSACITSRIYPTRADATGLRLTARNGVVLVHAMDIWQLTNE
jgi:beta-fructofuranosidase